jgi:hypothetical protein
VLLESNILDEECQKNFLATLETVLSDYFDNASCLFDVYELAQFLRDFDYLNFKITQDSLINKITIVVDNINENANELTSSELEDEKYALTECIKILDNSFTAQLLKIDQLLDEIYDVEHEANDENESNETYINRKATLDYEIEIDSLFSELLIN